MPLQFGEVDARDFVRAWKVGLMEHLGGGLYRAARNAAGEKFFNIGSETSIPRTFRLHRKR